MKKCLKHQETFFHNNHLWQIELKVRIWWNQQTIQKIKQIQAIKINSKDLKLRFKINKEIIKFIKKTSEIIIKSCYLNQLKLLIKRYLFHKEISK